ncbi:MAG TPA: glycerol-3-phosphate acyltransferase [Candidatus Dormibacteraeota bacterium]|nr:glycerol-3-phosphate acyltransferase [Candidatus Dormibacteraeota bacterium]
MDASGPLLVAGALAGGYAVGCIPVAWLVVRREERRRAGVERIDRSSPFARPPGSAPPLRGALQRSNPGTLDVLAVGGLRVAVVTVVLELLKGAAVGVGARLYDDATWFTALAIAGCVVGDAFPVGVRRGRRGVVPLVSGVWAAMPGIWAAGFLIAIPALLLAVLSGAAFEAVVVITVPLAFLLGTRDPGTLPAAAIIVAAIVGRSRLRRQAREQAVVDVHAQVR